MKNKVAVFAMTTLMLAACSTVPKRAAVTPAPAPAPAATAPSAGGYLPGDGPGAEIPVNLDAIPDAVPKREPLHPYANRPYIALGKTYTPMTVVGNYKERGIASWYGKKFNGERTSSGEIYDMYGMTAAHPTLPLPSYARVTNLSNHKSVIVRVNDRGPFINDRIIDLSYTAAYKLGIINDGSAEVEVESLNPDVSVNAIAANTVQSQPLEAASPAAASPAISTSASAVPATPAISAAPVDVALAPVARPPAPVVPVTNPAVVTEPATDKPAPPAALAPLESKNNAVYLQLGAFSSQAGAEAYRDKMSSKLGNTGKQVKLTTNKDGLIRVNIGPYANLSEARNSAESMQDKLGFKPMVNLP